MAEFAVFYSWQSDLSHKYNRDLIERAAKAAIRRLQLDATFEDSPRFDQALEGTAGTAPIAETIYAKIEKSGIFIGDVSFVGETTSVDGNKKKKLLPNVNVLIELGYAARSLTWDRVILVMNAAYGPPEELPFDLKHRRFPISYKVTAETKEKIEQKEAELTSDLERAIAACMAAEHALVQEKIGLLDVHGLQWMRELGARDSFPAPERRTMGEIVGNQRLDDGLIRLIDIGMLKTDINAEAGLYAYHWSFVGKLVLKKLGFRA